MNCLLSYISISTWGTIKTNIYLSRFIQGLHNTTVAKMVGRSVDQKYELWAYIKARLKLGCSLKQLMTELLTT